MSKDPFVKQVILKLLNDKEWRSLGPSLIRGCLAGFAAAFLLLIVFIMMIIERIGG